MPASLTIAALAWNEAEHLPRCFKSLQPLIRRTGASTLILFDPDGDTSTLDIARSLADRVETSPFLSFAAQRNRALDLATTDWVLFIDPDERMTPPLADEIANLLTHEASPHPSPITHHPPAAYRVPRRNILFGREVRHTGWYPDYQVRLLQRAKCRYDERQEVHEYPQVHGATGTLSAPLIHFNYRTWRQFYEKQVSYAGLHARALYRAGHRARPRSLVGQPWRELKRRYIEYQGYKDGLLGIALSLAMAAYTLLVYVKLLRHQQKRKTDS